MKERHSILRPLTVDEQEIFAIEICNFFSPHKYKENCKILGLEPDQKTIRPLTFGNFLNYLKNHRNIEGHRYQYSIRNLIHKFIENALVLNAGSGQGSPPFNACYYSQIELTEKQKTNPFWLGNILGEGFLMEKYKPVIIRIEGVYENGESGTGSGILINENTILTCRHNLLDLKEYKCYFQDDELNIDQHFYHEKHDIGIVKLTTPIKLFYYPYFGKPYELDSTLTMGYPPLRGMREAPLITQKGEINAKSKDWFNSDCITISSTVRPGNSGGPVISLRGYVVGIVTQYANSASSVSADKNGFKDNNAVPFYNAIASTSLIEILKELDPDIRVPFENYQ